MKIKIKDFGPIRNCEFDLEKDFHLIVGENNVGKSYAITIIYLIIKSALNAEEIGYFIYRHVELNPHKLIGEISENEINQQNVNDVVEYAIKEILNATFVKDLRASLTGTFETTDVLSNQFSGDDLCIELETDSSEVKLGVVDKQLSIKAHKLKRKILLKQARKLRANKFTDKEIVIYYKDSDPTSRITAVNKLISTSVIEFYLDVARQVNSIHYLPASRSGLYQALSAFGQIVAELSKSRSFLTRKVELPGISEPLSDYFIKLSNITISKKSTDGSPINKIAEEIERDILKGKVNYDSKAKRLIFLPHGTSLKLDLSTTSSMVSELSPIVSYLRYVIQQPPRYKRMFPYVIKEQISDSSPMIIIEEPEAHLHPEIQIRLTDIFASLINHGVKIVITSHSNYIFNKVNNLILGKEININAIEASVFKMTEEGSIGHILNVDDLGIDDENFVDCAEQLYNEKSELIRKINNNVYSD
jgi:predicted ATPase